MEIKSRWNADTHRYTFRSDLTYESIVSESALLFEDAEYLYEPIKRPYYGAWAPEFNLDRMKDMASVLLVSGISATVLFLLFFTYLFISRQKLRTAVERSLGVGKLWCVLSLAGGMITVAVPAAAVGAVAAWFMTNRAISTVFESAMTVDTRYSNWSNAADASVNMTEIADELIVEPRVFIFVGLCIAAAAVCAAFAGAIANLRSEPIVLLSGRKE
ncbi:MAG: hypothetical protein LBL49_07570 [Clostridiales Family XIII bacterium]|nr:hypothetical protein [Clostridiales Family XIII bacterium]